MSSLCCFFSGLIRVSQGTEASALLCLGQPSLRVGRCPLWTPLPADHGNRLYSCPVEEACGHGWARPGVPGHCVGSWEGLGETPAAPRNLNLSSAPHLASAGERLWPAPRRRSREPRGPASEAGAFGKVGTILAPRLQDCREVGRVGGRVWGHSERGTQSTKMRKGRPPCSCSLDRAPWGQM